MADGSAALRSLGHVLSEGRRHAPAKAGVAPLTGRRRRRPPRRKEQGRWRMPALWLFDNRIGMNTSARCKLRSFPRKRAQHFFSQCLAQPSLMRLPPPWPPSAMHSL